MGLPRVRLYIIPALFIGACLRLGAVAQVPSGSLAEVSNSLIQQLFQPLPEGPQASALRVSGSLTHRVVRRPVDGGIREKVPPRFREKFAAWKSELLSTSFGREQWDRYASDRGFELTIVVSPRVKHGARTEGYLWDERGKLVAATITLGSRLDEGYPNPIYYPVLNSLMPNRAMWIDGRILAAAKLSHELAHVGQVDRTPMESVIRQENFIPVYVSRLRENGRDVNDEALVELARAMGGTPVQITEEREYRSEAEAFRYLSERIRDEPYFCYVLRGISRNLNSYAGPYQSLFKDPGLANAGACKAAPAEASVAAQAQ